MRKFSKEGPETVFYPFRDPEFFKSVKVDNYTGTIVWPNGVDLCPDVLYEMGKDVESSIKKTVHKRKNRAPSVSKRSQTRVAAKSKH